MPTARPFQAVSLASKPKRRGRPTKKRVKSNPYDEKPQLKATVSQATRDRLIAEAVQHPAYEGMAPDDVAVFVNAKLDDFIRAYPYWYGNLKPKKEATESQLKALEKARQRKVEIQREAEAPYVPCEEESLKGTMTPCL